MPNPTDPRDHFDATPRSRRNFLLLVVALGLSGFVLSYFVEPALFVHLKLLLPCEQAQWLRGLLLGAALVTLLLALLLLAYAWRLQRAGQFPVSDRWLLRRTRIARGLPVRVLQVILALLAACLLGVTALLVHALTVGRWAAPPARCEVFASRPATDLVIAAAASTSSARPAVPRVNQGRSA